MKNTSDQGHAWNMQFSISMLTNNTKQQVYRKFSTKKTFYCFSAVSMVWFFGPTALSQIHCSRPPQLKSLRPMKRVIVRRSPQSSPPYDPSGCPNAHCSLWTGRFYAVEEFFVVVALFLLRNSPASVHQGSVYPDPGPLRLPVCHTHPGGWGEAGEEGLPTHIDRNTCS